MPNNGTKIYTETVGVVKYGIDLIADVYKVLGVSPLQTLNAYCDNICANTHGKINKYAKYKAYRIDTFHDPTEAQRKEINYGLSQALITLPNGVSVGGDYSSYSVKPWGQWEPPRPNIDWHRPTDFDRYNHKAVPFVKGLKIYSSAGEQYHRPIYVPNGYNNTAYMQAEVDLETSINAEIRFSDLRVDSGNTELGNLRLTMLLLSGDNGGTFRYAAQSERPIKYEWGKAVVTLTTSDIRNLDSHNNMPNMIVVGLCEEMDINADHTFDGAVPDVWSLDINAAGFDHFVVNDGIAILGQDADAGQPVINDVYIYGRFAANPLPETQIIARSDGSATLELVGDNHIFLTWTGKSPSSADMPNNLELTIGVVLMPVSGSGGNSMAFDCYVDLEDVDSDIVTVGPTGIYILGNINFDFRADDLHGEYTAKLTYGIGVKKQGASTHYHLSLIHISEPTRH